MQYHTFQQFITDDPNNRYKYMCVHVDSINCSWVRMDVLKGEGGTHMHRSQIFVLHTSIFTSQIPTIEWEM